MARKLTDFRRLYLRLRVTRKRQENKRKYVEYKGGSCEICGYNKCIAGLTFHHRIESEKEFQISDGKTRPWDKVKKELDKCMLLCSNCHNELHWENDQKVLEEKEAYCNANKRSYKKS